ncbi:MAG: hypothetical protein M0R51_12430 [Clostridia bacterium]|jgi:hypothetical protein|nr:hypothetical protein [Clostridia bacterium]
MSKELEALKKIWNGNPITGKDYDFVKKALTTDKTLIDKIKTKCEIHQIGSISNDYHGGYRQAMSTILNIIKESEEEK